MLFKEIIAVYGENHKKTINTKYRVKDCYDIWDILLPLGFKAVFVKIAQSRTTP
jgi:hypothetical protein